jgi:hypothetical protein
LWNKAAVAYFKFASVNPVSDSRLRDKIWTRTVPNTKQERHSLNSDVAGRLMITYLQHHDTGSLLSSLEIIIIIDRTLNRVPLCYLQQSVVWNEKTHGPDTERLVWTRQQDAVFISSLQNPWMTRTRKTLISVKLSLMHSAINTRKEFINKVPVCKLDFHVTSAICF